MQEPFWPETIARIIMTQALCLNCGNFKHGAFAACEACGFCPVNDCDLACSLALTDHYFVFETLRDIGRSISERGRPRLPPEQEEQLLATVRAPALRRIIGIAATMPAPATDAGNKKGGVLERWFGRRSKAGR
jgi:hypothetical protein